jgi:hypothetical protein
MILFIIVAIICSGINDTWVEHTDWLINSVDDLKTESCRKHLSGTKHDVRFLGNLESFDLASMLFYLTGMVFGTTYSMAERIDAVDWIKTPAPYRLLRTLLALVISVTIYFIFSDNLFSVSSAIEMS